MFDVLIAVQFWNHSCGFMLCHMVQGFVYKFTFRHIRSHKRRVSLIAIVPAAVEWNAERYIIPTSSVKMSGYNLYRVSAAYAIWQIVSIPPFHSTHTCLFIVYTDPESAGCMYVLYDSHIKHWLLPQTALNITLYKGHSQCSLRDRNWSFVYNLKNVSRGFTMNEWRQWMSCECTWNFSK